MSVASEIAKALSQAGDPSSPPIPKGCVRPVTDPEAVWRAMHAEPIVEWDYNPFDRDRLP
jgi:hypothetical protein